MQPRTCARATGLNPCSWAQELALSIALRLALMWTVLRTTTSIMDLSSGGNGVVSALGLGVGHPRKLTKMLRQTMTMAGPTTCLHEPRARLLASSPPTSKEGLFQGPGCPWVDPQGPVPGEPWSHGLCPYVSTPQYPATEGQGPEDTTLSVRALPIAGFPLGSQPQDSCWVLHGARPLGSSCGASHPLPVPSGWTWTWCGWETRFPLGIIARWPVRFPAQLSPCQKELWVMPPSRRHSPDPWMALTSHRAGSSSRSGTRSESWCLQLPA